MEIIHLILEREERTDNITKVVNSLAIYQERLGHKVCVWDITPVSVNNPPEKKYKTKLFPAYKNKFMISRELAQEIRSVSKNSVFHIHGGFIPEFYHCTRLLKKADISYIFTPHGAYNTIAMERSKRIKQLYFNLFEKHVINHAKTIHCIGQSEAEALEQLARQHRYVLIPNGQNLEELDYEYHELKNEDSAVFGFCGRIDIHTKGLDLLMKGFIHFIKQRKGKGALWIIGDGEELPLLMEQARQGGVEHLVKFWGKRFGDEKLNIMANMDAFFHPSRNEGLPGTVLEAAGLGVPCVVSKASNMADYIRRYNAGIGLEINNEIYIADAMESIADRHRADEVKHLGENAQNMVQDAFHWQGIARKLITVYQS